MNPLEVIAWVGAFAACVVIVAIAAVVVAAAVSSVRKAGKN